MWNGRRSAGVLFAALSVLWTVGCGTEAPAQAVGDGNHGVDQSGAQALELTGSFPEAFGLVTNVRELDDGTLLVADPLTKVLLHVDMDRGTADTLGSEGPGPDEYRQPDAVYALEDGRSFLVDLGNTRFTIMEPDHSFGQTYPIASGTPGPGGNFEMKLPQAVDLSGGVYYQGRMLGFGAGDPPTHAPIRRWDPESDVVDDVAEIALPEVNVERSGSAGNQSVNVSPIPMAPEDEWDAGQDGRIAIARHSPYRLEWVDADGSVTTGPEVTYDPVPIGRAEQLEYQERRSESGGGLSISMENNNGQMSMTMQRGGPGGERPRVEDLDWPEVKPPFESVIVATNGTAWVRRSRPAGANPQYDVFDAQGRLTGAVELEGRRRIVSFTDSSVYVVHMDEFDLQHLERYRLP